MNDQVREVDKRGAHAGRRCAGAAIIFLLAAQLSVGAPGFAADESDGPPSTVSLPGMSDTVISEDMGVDDILAGVGANSDADADAAPAVEAAAPPAMSLPPLRNDAVEQAAVLPFLPDDALPPLMLEKSTLQADLSVVPGVTLNKIKTMSLTSLSAGPNAPPSCAPVLPPVVPLAAPPRLPVMEEAVNSQPDPFPVRNEPAARRHAVDESLPVPVAVKTLTRPAASSVTVIASRGGTHRVTRGETLADVAALYYRDRNRWVDIYDANRDMIDKGSLEPGQILAIP